MGFYQVCPGTQDYIIGTPIFDKVTINLQNGKKFTIKAKQVSPKNLYIQSATLNGVSYTKSWFTHSDILNGSELVFNMGAAPNKNWGASQSDRPVSEKYDAATTLPYSETADEFFLQTAKVILKCEDAAARIYYTTDGSRPTDQSLIYDKPVLLNKTTNLRFVSYKAGLLPSLPVSLKVTKLEFENFRNFEGEGKFDKGLNYRYYLAQVMDPDDLDKLTPLETGILPTFTIDQRKRADYFGYVFSGFLDVPRDGIYTFSIKVNDRCTFYLDGKPFLSGGLRTIALRKGKYEVLEKYFQLGARKFNIINWEGPRIPKQEIPESSLFH
jgi:hypothetical protein